jgi:hypothetical protein
MRHMSEILYTRAELAVALGTYGNRIKRMGLRPTSKTVHGLPLFDLADAKAQIEAYERGRSLLRKS